MSFLIDIILGVLFFIVYSVCLDKMLQACYEKDKKNNKKVKKDSKNLLEK